jgi:RNA polymerase sigma-70 factor, ECF subfamily
MIGERAKEDWKQLRATVGAFVGRRVRGPDAEDVLQDIFVRIQRGLPKLHDDARFGPWVYQVARSAVADYFRAKQRTLPPEATDGQADSDPDDVAAELAGCVAAYVAKLPSPYREAVTLTELQGMTQAAAAEVVGVSLSGMKSRVQRGRAKLREMIGECCELTLDARGSVVDYECRSAVRAGTCGCS